jgi:N-hydroxyarylamine O-acetyltransferase
MTSDDIDLDAYFRRIGHTGPRMPGLETLRAIHEHHTTAIPFENLDVLLKRPIRLDPASLQRKLIHERRGGYCFEQNGLLAHVLRRLGFAVTPLAARVRWGVAEAVDTSRSHMLLKIDLAEGPYIADVGFGGQTPGVPLALTADLEQPTADSIYRLVHFGAGYELQMRVADAWSSLYRFTLEPQLQPDYEVANWYVSTHPSSIFVRNLLVARRTPGRRHTLLNGQFAIRRPDGRAEEWKLAGVVELMQILAEYFELDTAAMGAAAAVEEALERCLANAESSSS